MATDTASLFEFLCRLGDNTLVLGHRVSEWCGVSPVLEEDIALANVALDLIGQTQLWLGLAGEIEGKGRDADKLAFHRDVWDFRNVLLVEQPNGDFGQTMMRQFLFDAWHLTYLKGLNTSSNDRIAEIAEKSVKEVTYHLERSTDTVIGLGDGNEESHKRMQKALDRLYPFVGEMFLSDDVDAAMVAHGIAPDPAGLRSGYEEHISGVLTEATLEKPTDDFAHKGGKTGVRHTEHLGHMLTQMQWLQRAYPDATW
ncbi:phenylacetate-CoA oxygenase subunit PaaC [Sulfitobacter sp. F26204]|uniref:1,2-phenylacetyl-CoA epoxidase subunit PaaC n=1 Tax=Sulfitobacter sp. F26204 TaxID=2996014 RepID=UPI00225E2A03|nr:1,2-phenylacetyl-CoA epoxidase subunit PaaC [Sulfitobacter sp. F26204]MCX7558325.1 phenylacetate-CoA oxygenase subunit PaaC [Sulfitobacter sp. F26204]